MIPEPPMYIIKSFCIFHLNMKSELQTLCRYQYKIIGYKFSLRVILEEDREILRIGLFKTDGSCQDRINQ